MLFGNKEVKHYANSPETIIILNTFEREDIALKSIESLLGAIDGSRDRIKVIISDATKTMGKVEKINNMSVDDVIWTPKFTSAASSRNIAVTYALDKYNSEFICFLEDDFEYTDEWYEALVTATRENYGKMSPWDLAYGVFTASPHWLPKDRLKTDKKAGLDAYIFGAVADQRFMPLSHYLSVFRFWDPDILGVSYCQTGMQTSRNVMRGYCGGILTGKDLCRPIPEQESTWREGRKDVGPPAHDMDTKKFKVIREQAAKQTRSE